jgi:hypothetical protein
MVEKEMCPNSFQGIGNKGIGRLHIHASNIYTIKCISISKFQSEGDMITLSLNHIDQIKAEQEERMLRYKILYCTLYNR